MEGTEGIAGKWFAAGWWCDCLPNAYPMQRTQKMSFFFVRTIPDKLYLSSPDTNIHLFRSRRQKPELFILVTDFQQQIVVTTITVLFLPIP